MQAKCWTRLLSMLLAVMTLFSLAAAPAFAAVSLDNSGSLADGSSSVTIQKGTQLHILDKSTGGSIGGSYWAYTSDQGVTGPAYCVNWGLNMVSPSKRLEITGSYDRNPKTMGAFANGYPQRTLEQFKELHPDIQGIANLTTEEYAYATQLAIWATCGQLAVADTAFTAGRASLVKPTSDAQQIRVYESVVEILKLANSWTKQLYTGLYFHMEKDQLGSSLTIHNIAGLDGAAEAGQDGVQKETINGTEYYTRLMYVDSATSTYPNDYEIYVYSMNAPAGIIFVNENNQVFETRSQWGATMYEVPTPRAESTSLNANGLAYSGTFKICIPCDNAAEAGSVKIEAYADITQFNLYLAYNPVASEQSYIIADPAYVGRFAEASIAWNQVAEEPNRASLQVQKVDGSAMPLEGAVFELTGSKGTSRTGISDQNGLVEWTDLPADETYILTETKAPAGYTIVEPRNITLKVGQTSHVTVQDDTAKHLTIKKIDAQNGSTLEGAVFRFEQIDGDYVTTATTGFDGMLDFAGDELPFGSYRITEERAPTGYEKDSSVQTVDWDGTEDVTLTFQNVRQPTIVVSKVDGATGISLPGAVFNIYKDGELIDSAVTNDAGEIRFPIAAGEGYYEFEETTAPEGYQLDRTRHGIYIDPYDPQTEDDPVLTIENFNTPSLRIIKYDQQSGDRLPGATFEIYLDAELFDTRTTDENGEILLFDLEPGTYLVKEVAVDDAHVVISTPQQIELKAGQQETQTLVFLNQLKPGIHLVKLDSQTLQSIPNVRFEFKLVGGSYRQELLTDLNGEIDLSKLEPGSYEVRELEGPPGYLMDDSVRIVQIDPDENANFVFTNTPKPSLVIVKYDPHADAYLSGATFRIARIEDGTRYLDRVTGTDGRIVLTDLEPGVYSVQELEAPAGYVRNDTEYHVELFAGKESQLVVNNEAKPDLKIVKTNAVSGEPVAGVTFTVKMADGRTITTEATDAQGEILLEDMDPGVVEIWEQSVPDDYLLGEEHQLITLVPNQLGTVRFQNYPKPQLVIKKIDSVTGDPIQGARFHITYASNDTFSGEINDLGEYYTDETGRITLEKLSDGWYRVEEVEPAPGYAIKEPAIQECYIKAGTAKTLTFENVPLSALVIKKVDADTGAPLEGAWFRLRYLGGTSGTGGTIIGEYQTSSNGTIVVTGLEAGTYVVEEISAPDGYVINDSAQTVYLSGKEQDVITVVFENSKMGSLLIVKKDADTGEPLSDVEFLVTNSDGGVIGNSNGKFVTDSAGSIRIDGLVPGMTVIARETRTQPGYVLDDTPQTIKIKANETMILEFRNKSLGGMIIVKKDSVTGKPLEGVEFKITEADGTVVDNNGGATSSMGVYYTDENGQILLSGLVGTFIVTETKSIEGYTIHEATRSQTVVINPGDTQTITVLNDPVGGVEIIKVNASKTSERIPDTTFEIRRMDDALVDTITTDHNGRAYLALENGAYYAVEIEANPDFRLDDTPHYFEVKDGQMTTLRIKNEANSGILIHKVNTSGEGIYGVKFLLYDENRNPIGEFVSDDNGYVYITAEDLPEGANTSGRFYLRELEAAEGYILDEEYKTVYVRPGCTAEIEWVNEAITGQIQIYKYAAEYNAVTGTPAGTPLQGAVYEIVQERSGKVVDYITTDARGVAASKPLPLGRYKIVEVNAPAYWQVDDTVHDVTLEYAGQIIKLSAYDKPSSLGVTITKRGNAEVLAGSQMRYDFTVANTSNVPLDSFFWHDRIPTDAAAATVLTTGTYSARLNYRVLYKTNYQSSYQVLASNLLTSNNYSFALNAIPRQVGEVVTDIYFDFGRVPAGFQSVAGPTLTVQVSGSAVNGYQLVNRADAGGKYQGTWQTANASWVTIIRRYTTVPTLPKTGY